MADSLHDAATHHLPSFITAPGETDVLMVIVTIVFIAAVLGFGIFFLRLHTLPERMAHSTHKLQFEIVAVLGLIALFTHKHIFWVIGLVLALIEFPDFGTMMSRIARSVERLAGIKSNESISDVQAAKTTGPSSDTRLPAGTNEGTAALPPTSGNGPSNEKALEHA